MNLQKLCVNYTPWFRSVFSDEALIQFQRYLSGLIVSGNKTVDGINRIVVHESRNQSGLNRMLSENPFSESALNRQRLALLDSLSGTRMKPKGILSLDDTLLPHYGKHFHADVDWRREHIAKLWNPVDERYVWAHNLVNVHYSDDQTDYPVAFRLWKPARVRVKKIEAGLQAANIKLRASKFALKETAPKKWRHAPRLLGVWSRHQGNPEVAALYASKLLIGRRLLRQFVTEHPDLNLPVTFDNWYTQPAFCRFLDKELDVPYVGTLANDNELVLKHGQETIDAFAFAGTFRNFQIIAPPAALRIRYQNDSIGLCIISHVHFGGPA